MDCLLRVLVVIARMTSQTVWVSAQHLTCIAWGKDITLEPLGHSLGHALISSDMGRFLTCIWEHVPTSTLLHNAPNDMDCLPWSLFLHWWERQNKSGWWSELAATLHLCQRMWSQKVSLLPFRLWCACCRLLRQRLLKCWSICPVITYLSMPSADSWCSLSPSLMGFVKCDWPLVLRIFFGHKIFISTHDRWAIEPAIIFCTCPRFILVAWGQGPTFQIACCDNGDDCSSQTGPVSNS